MICVLRVLVTPLVGVWIETSLPQAKSMMTVVTPLVGVWIETYQYRAVHWYAVSHPSWVCGLKQNNEEHNHK